jgi:hypothetical protein
MDGFDLGGVVSKAGLRTGPDHHGAHHNAGAGDEIVPPPQPLTVFANDALALLLARLDNLGKGPSGAAVQCMNLRLGLPEG